MRIEEYTVAEAEEIGLDSTAEEVTIGTELTGEHKTALYSAAQQVVSRRQNTRSLDSVIERLAGQNVQARAITYYIATLHRLDPIFNSKILMSRLSRSFGIMKSDRCGKKLRSICHKKFRCATHAAMKKREASLRLILNTPSHKDSIFSRCKSAELASPVVKRVLSDHNTDVDTPKPKGLLTLIRAVDHLEAKENSDKEQRDPMLFDL